MAASSGYHTEWDFWVRGYDFVGDGGQRVDKGPLWNTALYSGSGLLACSAFTPVHSLLPSHVLRRPQAHLWRPALASQGGPPARGLSQVVLKGRLSRGTGKPAQGQSSESVGTQSRKSPKNLLKFLLLHPLKDSLTHCYCMSLYSRNSPF